MIKFLYMAAITKKLAVITFALIFKDLIIVAVVKVTIIVAIVTIKFIVKILLITFVAKLIVRGIGIATIGAQAAKTSFTVLCYSDFLVQFL